LLYTHALHKLSFAPAARLFYNKKTMIDLVRVQFEKEKIDALLITDTTNILYLAGVKASHAYVLLTKKHVYYLTDSRYTEKAHKHTADEWKVVGMEAGIITTIENLCFKHKVKNLGVEPHAMHVNFYHRLKNSGSPIKLVKTSRLVEKVRMIKRDNELRALRQSQKLNEQALKLLLREVKVNKTEADLAWKLRMIANDLKTSGFSFDPIIAFGAHSAMPHHEVSPKKKLRKGDLILIDMGLMVKGYASDMTRTFFTKTPTSQQREVDQTVLEAQKKAIKMIMPGIRCDDVDRAARKHISRNGYSKKFGHATGHGIGMYVHEIPGVAKGSEMELEPGMVITIEPGIYLEGRLGVRIEDMLEVTTTGSKNLTKFPKEIGDMLIKL